jgi:hypothetical protein
MTCIISFFFRRKKVPEKVGHFLPYFVDFYGFLLCGFLRIYYKTLLTPAFA